MQTDLLWICFDWQCSIQCKPEESHCHTMIIILPHRAAVGKNKKNKKKSLRNGRILLGGRGVGQQKIRF
jgi:hypothetical protein